MMKMYGKSPQWESLKLLVRHGLEKMGKKTASVSKAFLLPLLIKSEGKRPLKKPDI